MYTVGLNHINLHKQIISKINSRPYIVDYQNSQALVLGMINHKIVKGKISFWLESVKRCRGARLQAKAFKISS